MSDTAPARSSGIDSETGEWTPAFPGQRRPFPAGHTYSMVSGIWSERVIGPLTEQIMAGILADRHNPYLAQPLLRALVMKYARAKATERLLEQLLDEIGFPFGPHDDDDDEQDAGGIPLWRRREVAWAAYMRALGRKGRLLGKLGLSPMARATAPPDALWRQAEAQWLCEQRGRPAE